MDAYTLYARLHGRVELWTGVGLIWPRRFFLGGPDATDLPRRTPTSSTSPRGTDFAVRRSQPAVAPVTVSTDDHDFVGVGGTPRPWHWLAPPRPPSDENQAGRPAPRLTPTGMTAVGLSVGESFAPGIGRTVARWAHAGCFVSRSPTAVGVMPSSVEAAGYWGPIGLRLPARLVPSG